MIRASIIIPVYNAQIHLKKCLSSVVKQTEKNIEIILINDGSTDKSKEIIEKFKKNDSRIVYIEHVNHGVSYTRNIGIKIAKGKYILFVDSDDYIDLDTVERLCTYGDKSNADVIRYNWFKQEKKVVTKEQFKNKIYPYIIKSYYFASVCYQLIKRKIIIENNIFFEEEIKYGEDALFNMKLYLFANRVLLISRNYYHYIFNTSSFTRTHSLNTIYNKCDDTIYVYKKLYKYIKLFNMENMFDTVSQRILRELNESLKGLFSPKIKILLISKIKIVKKYMNNSVIITASAKSRKDSYLVHGLNIVMIKLIKLKFPIIYSLVLYFWIRIKYILRKEV